MKGDTRMQHMRRNTDNSEGKEFISILVFGILVFAGAAWMFSSVFGFDMSTGAKVLGSLLFLSFTLGLSVWGRLYDEHNTYLVHPGNIWPILLAMLWGCWWPALDFWASRTLGPFSSHTIWWAAWYTKYGVFFAIIFIGYGIKWLWRGR